MTAPRGRGSRQAAWERAAQRRAIAERNQPRWPGQDVTPAHREPGAPTPAEEYRAWRDRDRVGRPETPDPPPEPPDTPS